MSEHSVLLRREPLWRPAEIALIARSAPWDWIREAGSLTARLRAGCRSGFNVLLLRQAWRTPFRGEAARLELHGRHRTLIREVMLRDGSCPLVLARSIIPVTALRGPHCALARLGNRPLGEVLFADPALRRLGLECCRLTAKDWVPELGRLCTTGGGVWGRRSVYGINGLRLLVAEFFLPAALMPSAAAQSAWANAETGAEAAPADPVDASAEVA